MQVKKTQTDENYEPAFDGTDSIQREFIRFILLAMLGTAASYLSVNIPYTEVFIEGRWIFGFMGIVLLRRWWLTLLLICLLSIVGFHKLPLETVFVGNMLYAFPIMLVIRFVHTRFLSRIRSMLMYGVAWLLLILACYQVFSTPAIWGFMAFLRNNSIWQGILEGWREQPFFIESLLVGIISAALMVTIRINATLREREAHLRTTLNSIGDAVITTDINGQVSNMNPVAEELTGWELGAAKDKPLPQVFNIVHAQTQEVVENPVDKVLATGKITGLANHTMLISKDGTEYQIADSAAPIKDANGNVSGVVLVFRDVTAEYRIRQEIEQTNVLLKGIVEQSPVPMALVTSDSVVRLFNQACLDFLGAPNGNFMGKHLHEIEWTWQDYTMDGVYLKPEDTPLAKALRGEATHTQELKLVDKDGNIRYSLTEGVPIRDAEGNIVASFMIFPDITEHKQAEEKLRHSQERWQSLVENAPDIIFTVNRKGRILSINHPPTGLSPKEVIGTKVYDYVAPEHHQVVQQAIQHVFETGTPSNYQIRARGPNDTMAWYSTRLGPIRQDEGEIDSVILITRDITEQKRAEEALRESELKYRTLIEQSLQGVVIAQDNPVRLEFANRAAAKILGRPVEALLQARSEELSELIHSEDRERFFGNFKNRLAGKDVETEAEYRTIHKDGGIRWIHSHSSVIEYKESPATLTIFVDITERKQAEMTLQKALQNAERRRDETQALLTGARAVLKHRQFSVAARTIFDSAKQLIGASAGYVALLSESGEENEVLFLDAGGQPCTVDPELPMPIRGLRSEAYHTGRVVYENDFANSEWMHFMPEGHTHLENVMFAPLIIEGKTVGLMGLANKPGGFIEEDKQMAAAFGELAAIALHNSRLLEALRESEERFRIISELISDFAYLARVEENGAVVSEWVTEAFFRISGYENQQEIAISNTNGVHPEDHPVIEQRMAALLSGQDDVSEYRMITKSGETRWLRDYGRPVWDNEQQRVVEILGAAQDITARKCAEDALQKAKDTLEDEVARQTAEIRRQQQQLEVILNNIDDAIVFTDAKGTILYVNPAFTTLLGNKPKDMLGNHMSYPSKDVFSPIGGLLNAVQTGKAWRGEMVIRGEDGQPRELDMAVVPVLAPSGEVERFVGSFRDIGHLKQLDRMKTHFMRNVTHEFKTPLSNIRLYSELLRSSKTPEKRAHYLETLDTQTDKLVQLTEKVIDVVRFAGVVDEWNKVPVSNIIQDIAKRFEARAGDADITLTVEALPAELPPVRGNPVWLGRALSELVENAIKFTEPGGAVWLTARLIKQDATRRIAIDVCDNGIGLNAEDQAQISDAFVRGAQVSQTGSIPGIGLGLTIVRLILERHGGELVVTSASESQGSTFTMLLPPLLPEKNRSAV